jgi:putative serine protease PepD
MQRDDELEQFTPLTPAGSSQEPAPTAGAPYPVPAIPANHAGEPNSPMTPVLSSRPARTGDRRLAGVLAVSLLSATVASVATVGVLAGARPVASTNPGAASASGATGSTPLSITGSDAVVNVAAAASPAVVTITVESANFGEGNGFDPRAMPATGVGSGFVFDASGLILTNRHVIEGSGGITVTFQDGTELPGTVVAQDEVHDLAVVRVTAAGLATIEIGDSSALKVGQLVVAIGSPLGTFTESVTSGILSAVDRTIQVGSQFSRQTTSMSGLLQTDAAINEGNSGGPLLDSTGRVIGVNVAVAASAQGIGFAVPIELATAIMAQARAGTGGA